MASAHAQPQAAAGEVLSSTFVVLLVLLMNAVTKLDKVNAHPGDCAYRNWIIR